MCFWPRAVSISLLLLAGCAVTERQGPDDKRHETEVAALERLFQSTTLAQDLRLVPWVVEALPPVTYEDLRAPGVFKVPRQWGAVRSSDAAVGLERMALLLLVLRLAITNGADLAQHATALETAEALIWPKTVPEVDRYAFRRMAALLTRAMSQGLSVEAEALDGLLDPDVTLVAASEHLDDVLNTQRAADFQTVLRRGAEPWLPLKQALLGEGTAPQPKAYRLSLIGFVESPDMAKLLRKRLDTSGLARSKQISDVHLGLEPGYAALRPYVDLVRFLSVPSPEIPNQFSAGIACERVLRALQTDRRLVTALRRYEAVGPRALELIYTKVNEKTRGAVPKGPGEYRLPYWLFYGSKFVCHPVPDPAAQPTEEGLYAAAYLRFGDQRHPIDALLMQLVSQFVRW